MHTAAPAGVENNKKLKKKKDGLMRFYILPP
jgi:hypothetical protein